MATMDQVTVAVFQARYDDQVSAGAAAATRAIEANSVAFDANEQKVTAATRSATALVNRYDEVSSAAAKLAKAQREAAAAQDTMSAAVATGEKTQAQAAAVTAALNDRVERARIGLEAARAANASAASSYTAMGDAAALSARRVEAANAATDSAGTGMRRVGQIVGQAGFQLQDFAVQVGSGTSALTALSQQGSQMLGVFGTGGAIAGAVLAVGILALQFVKGKDAAEQMGDAIKAQEEGYKRTADAAERWRDGLDKEAQKVVGLRDYYQGLSQDRRDYLTRDLERQQKDLLAAQDALRNQVQGTLGGRVSSAQLDQANAAAANLPADQRALYLSNPDLDRMRQGVAVIEEFRNAGKVGEEELARFSARLREVAGDAKDRYSVGLRSAADEMEKSGPAARDLSASLDKVQSSLRAMNGELSATEARLKAMALRAAQDPFAAMNADIGAIADRARALQVGGLPAFERVTSGQDQQEAITKRATRAQEDYAKALRSSGMASEEAAAKAEAAAPDFIASATRIVTSTAELEKAKKAAEDAKRAAEEGARRAQQSSQEAEARVSKNAAGLQNSWDGFWEKADTRAEDRAKKEADKATETAQRAQEQQEKRAAESFDRTVERYSADLSRSTVDALFDGTKQGESMFERLASVFGRSLKTAVAAALDTEVVRPALKSLLSEFGGSGSGSSGGGSLLSSLGSLFGGSGGVSQANATNAAIGASGTYGPATPAQVAAAGGSDGSGFSLSSLSNLFSAGRSGFNLFSGGAGAFDLGSLSMIQGTELAGLLSTPISGAAAAAQATATNTALAGMGGAMGPATPGAVASAGGSASGVTTIGGVLGGVGAGFGVGMLASSVVGGIRGTVDPLGGMGGALAGAGIGFLVGGPVGALIGGALGGAGGAMFGPTKSGMASRSGGDVLYGVNESGQLAITQARGKRWDEAGARSEIQGQFDTINTAAATRGLTFDAGFSGAVGFGKASSNPQALSEADLVRSLRGGSTGVQTALYTLGGRGAGLDEAFKAVDWVKQVYEPLTTRTSAFGQQMKALTEQYATAIAQATSLGIAEGDLAAVRDKAVGDLQAQRDAQYRSLTGGVEARRLRAANDNLSADLLTYDVQAGAELLAFRKGLEDLGATAAEVSAELVKLEAVQGAERLAVAQRYAEALTAIQQTAAGRAAGSIQGVGAYASSLRLGDASPLSAQSRLSMASGAFDTAAGKAAGGDFTALGSITSLADSFLAASRAVNGSGLGYVADFQRVLDALERVAAQPADVLTASVLVAETRTQTVTLEAALVALKAELVGLRREVQQAGAAPARLAA